MPKGTAGYRDIRNPASGRTTILPFDNGEYFQEPYCAVEASDGKLYFAGFYSGIQVYDTEYGFQIFHTDDTSNYEPIDNGETYPIPDADNLKNLKIYTPSENEQVYAADVKGGYIYAACGKKGIVVLDEDLNELNVIQCGSGFAVDLKIYGDYLLTSETSNGMGIYRIEGTNLIKLGSYVDSKYGVRQARADNGFNYALVQLGTKDVAVIDLSDVTHPQIIEGLRQTLNGMLYYRNLTEEFIVDGEHIYAGAYGNAGNVVWYDLGGDAPRLVSNSVKSYLAVRGGFTAYKNAQGEPRALGTYNASLVLINPLDTQKQYEAIYNISGMNGVIDGKTVPYTGKPYVRGNLLIECDKLLGMVSFVDISDITKPVAIYKFQLGGNCEIACATDDYVLIPAGHQGLIKFELADIKPSFKISSKEEGNTVTVTAIPKSFNVNEKDMVLICAEYDSSNRVLSTYVHQEAFTYNSGTIELSFNKNADTDYIKMFVWNSIPGMVPYIHHVIIQ